MRLHTARSEPKPLCPELGARCVLQANGVRLKKPTFKPLGPDEEPGARTLLAIYTKIMSFLGLTLTSALMNAAGQQSEAAHCKIGTQASVT